MISKKKIYQSIFKGLSFKQNGMLKRETGDSANSVAECEKRRTKFKGVINAIGFLFSTIHHQLESFKFKS